MRCGQDAVEHGLVWRGWALGIGELIRFGQDLGDLATGDDGAVGRNDGRDVEIGEAACQVRLAGCEVNARSRCSALWVYSVLAEGLADPPGAVGVAAPELAPPAYQVPPLVRGLVPGDG